jgi:hypothetical protein
MRRRIAVIALLFAAAACGKSGSLAKSAPVATPPTAGGLPWPAPSNPLELARKAGLDPETHETLVFHVHAHLDVYVNGKAVVVPAGIGININDPAVHSGPGPAYGGISPACAQVCISPLHTHDTSGIIHTEAKTAVPNKLGAFLTEWNVKLDRSCVGGYCSGVQVFVDGKRFTGDPATIQLTDKKEIAFVIGTPPKTIPTSFPA